VRTITFYSYKGGTGRTLAVANTARFLAQCNRSVFVLDLDLEAPGLHYKFGLRRDGGSRAITGLVDLIHTVKTTRAFPDLSTFVFRVEPELPGQILLLPAGDAPSASYSRQLAAIKLHELFTLPGSGDASAVSAVPVAVPLFLELKEQIRQKYSPDYLLIDSRTGITEIGGIAVRLMPDTLVCLVHNNSESLAGARKVLQNVRAASRSAAQHLEILTVLARIPELPLGREREVLTEALATLNESPGHDDSIGLSEVLSLRSDPDLEVAEALRIGGDTTANDSVLLRDYYKLFRKLGLDAELPADARSVLAELADADRNDQLRPFVLSTRALRGESTLAPIRMRERLARRDVRAMKIVKAAYLVGHKYQQFIDDVLEQLLETVGRLPSDPLPNDAVRWDLLAVHLREGVLDFCQDLYYLTENRAHLVEIVQLGWCRDFTGYVKRNSSIASRLLELSTSDLRQTTAAILATVPRLSVGVLGDTPAASEAHRQLSPILAASQLIAHGSESDLLTWLSGCDDRIAVCDSVVARRLDDLYRGRGAYEWTRPFAFARPVPLGIVYPREDRSWRKDISRAIAKSLVTYLRRQPALSAAESWQGIADEFMANRVEALAFSDLRASLLLDLPFEEALEWDRTLNSVLSEARHNSTSAPASLTS
jgi:MinD-like ATPase involved in chromosome partitioning or flagellar assembly